MPNDRVAELEDKIFLKRGTKVIPLGQMGTEWIQVKTPDGQIGFVNYKNLEGSTFKGRTRKFSVGSYDKDLGTSVDYERNKRITTTHYERLPKLTTTTKEKSVDHLKCSQCGYNWDINVEEETKRTKYF